MLELFTKAMDFIPEDWSCIKRAWKSIFLIICMLVVATWELEGFVHSLQTANNAAEQAIAFSKPQQLSSGVAAIKAARNTTIKDSTINGYPIAVDANNGEKLDVDNLKTTASTH